MHEEKRRPHPICQAFGGCAGGKEEWWEPATHRAVVDFGPGLRKRETFAYNLPEVTSAYEILGVENCDARFGTDPGIWNLAMVILARTFGSRLKDRSLSRRIAALSGDPHAFLSLASSPLSEVPCYAQSLGCELLTRSSASARQCVSTFEQRTESEPLAFTIIRAFPRAWERARQRLLAPCSMAARAQVSGTPSTRFAVQSERFP